MRYAFKLYLQKPPRVAWCLRLKAFGDNGGEVQVRVWYEEFTDRRVPPPPELTRPMAALLVRLAIVSLED